MSFVPPHHTGALLMCAALLVGCLTAFSTARAQDPSSTDSVFADLTPASEDAPTPINESWTFTTYFENDLFWDTDSNYTNGIKLSWISPDITEFTDRKELPAWSHGLVGLLPFINEPGLQRNIVFSLGQNIYTPEDIERSDLIEDDRPYAGWLYLGTAFHNRNPKRLDSIELQLGVVGPLSFAEQAQTVVHEFRDIAKPNGWGNQLDNEPGIALIYERKWRLFQQSNESGLGVDLIPHVGAAVGNVYTYANAGFETRAGYNLPSDFGNSLIRPGGDTSAPVDSADPRRKRRFGFHLFASVDGRAVARDIFLDGNTFSSSHSVDKKHFVADLAFGASVVGGPWKLTFARVLRTREFKGQPDNHEFGSAVLSYTF